ncbi:hypothetical protein ACS0TY_025363 [Phlomoides rotata]
MALVTGGRSTLNPNAPLFIPAAMRQVEDFSPEWWDLVTTSTWFRDYWVSQHPGEDIFGEVEDGFNGNNVVQLLPDNIDLDVDEDILNMESQFEEFLQSSEAEFGFAGRGILMMFLVDSYDMLHLELLNCKFNNLALRNRFTRKRDHLNV